MSGFLQSLKTFFITVFVIGVLAAIVFFGCNHFLYLHAPIATNLNASVLIDAERSQGSGVVYRNGDKVFIWTCQHVIACATHHRVKLDIQNKNLKYEFETDRVKVKSKIFNRDLAESGYISINADIIRFSAEDDIAVLEVLEPRLFHQSVQFPRNKNFVPPMGTSVFHIGCMLGWPGFGGCSDGTMGLPGNDMDQNGKVLDKVQCAFHFGSSGGGIFESTTGQCIGLVARSNDRTAMSQGYMIPWRRMVQFAERLDCMWALDKNVAVPNGYCHVLTDDHLYTDVEALLRAIRENK